MSSLLRNGSVVLIRKEHLMFFLEVASGHLVRCDGEEACTRYDIATLDCRIDWGSTNGDMSESLSDDRTAVIEFSPHVNGLKNRKGHLFPEVSYAFQLSPLAVTLMRGDCKTRVTTHKIRCAVTFSNARLYITAIELPTGEWIYGAIAYSH